MRFSTASLLAVAVAPIAVSAAPFRRGTDNNTLLVLQFAHVLEQLETQFYKEALGKFQASDFTSAGFSSADIPIQQFTAIQSDEASHVTALEAVITSFGEKPLSTCKFDFSSVLTDVATMAPVARLVENVGVGAYLGAAHLVEDPVILTTAASIATIEARHQTILNVMQGGSAIPQGFDIPLLPQEVLAIAGPFISGCDLGVPANAALSVTNTGTITTGTSLQFKSPAINGSTDNFHCQMLVGGAPFSISLALDQCVVPPGINGPVAIWVTSDDQPLNNNARDRGSNAIVAGPLMAFIDIQPESLGQLVRNNGAGTPPSSTSTMPPSQASSLISSLSVFWCAGRARWAAAFACGTVRASGTSLSSSSSPSSSSSSSARARGKLGSGSPSASASPSPSSRSSPALPLSNWASSSSAAVRSGERCGACVDDAEAAGAVTSASVRCLN
ncbi:ferritin-like domain-containing protein [Lactarius psammicola]|nr:ferritin-like domain-containing protein [Lactarius psammicola]